MLPYLEEKFGNPHSDGHVFGWEASDAVKSARAKVAELINADDDEVVFTSGATESCNLAIRGLVKADTESRNRIVTVATEHPAVLETVKDLQRSRFDTVILPVERDGLVNLSVLKDALDDKTLIVSVMAANNEIGVIQPIEKIAEICHSVGAIFHTDATQAVGRIDVDVENWGVDLLSMSAHKVYGPKGIGALYIRSGVKVDPIITGGMQEFGLRSGTVPTALVVGFGEACELANYEFANDARRIDSLTKQLYCCLEKRFPNLQLFGHTEKRIAGNLNVGLLGLSAQYIVKKVSNRIAISTGSACSSAIYEPSRVLIALGYSREVAETGIRISLGRFTTSQEIETASVVLSELNDTV